MWVGAASGRGMEGQQKQPDKSQLWSPEAAAVLPIWFVGIRDRRYRLFLRSSPMTRGRTRRLALARLHAPMSDGGVGDDGAPSADVGGGHLLVRRQQGLLAAQTKNAASMML